MNFLFVFSKSTPIYAFKWRNGRGLLPLRCSQLYSCPTKVLDWAIPVGSDTHIKLEKIIMGIIVFSWQNLPSY